MQFNGEGFIFISCKLFFFFFFICCGEENETEFNYDPNGEKGPAQWGRIHPERGACSHGSMQSPIDLMVRKKDLNL
jgi:carbonic anhydrase